MLESFRVNDLASWLLGIGGWDIMCAIKHDAKATGTLVGGTFTTRPDDLGFPIGLLGVKLAGSSSGFGDIGPWFIITGEIGY